MSGERLDFRRLNKILSMLKDRIDSDFPKESEVSRQWSCMHLFSCSQLVKVPALEKGLSMELAAITAALHDYGLLCTGIRDHHAEKGAALLDGFLDRYNELYGGSRGIVTKKERGIIKHAVRHHSEKNVYSDDPYLELLKDVDSLDRYLHGVVTEGDYLVRTMRYIRG